MTKKMKISQVKLNPDNPRFIKDEKYKKLVKSIKEFPEMLRLREIVVDENFVVLGGNMRLRACREAGLKEVFVKVAEGLTEEQKKEFVIKDNVAFGEWDMDLLANDYDPAKLEDWGMDLEALGLGLSKREIDEEELNKSEPKVICQGMELCPHFTDVSKQGA